MNKKAVTFFVFVIVVLIGVAVYKLQQTDEGIRATGTVEVTKIDIMPKMSGYMADLTIKEGDFVAVGEQIVRILRPDLDAQVLRDQAALEKSQIQLIDLRKGSRLQERQQAAANFSAANATYEKAHNDYRRYQQLYQQSAISRQQLDDAKASFDIAYNSLVAVQAQQHLIEEGNRPDVISAQQLEVERSQAVLTASKTAIEDTIVKSPLAGKVLSKNYENGEYVNAGGAIVTIADLNDMWIKIYIASTELGQITTGQTAQIKIDSFPGEVFEGQISEISQTAEFTPRQSITPRERANMVFAVKVKVKNVNDKLKPGMPADVIVK